MLQSGAYAELELSAPAYLSREELWSRSLPELEKDEIQAFASRCSLPVADIRSVSNLARTRARLAGNGVPDPVRNHVAAACSVVTRRSASRFAAPSVPKRRAEDLILPEPLYRQILEVAKFFELQSRVDEDWGFGRLTAGTGMKVLFTGDPGTGKTLSAEVIASLLGLSLCKVDLANIVSKWVGETEKNLDATFQEAEESHSVLFFDEAEALFGKRGEVQSGTDRYANLEVSYLLQRLEACHGLVILASNVKDQIDPAFIRRFQVVVHFPRPGVAERQRMWRLAFPESAPVDGEVNLAALARLEMTGAAIMSAARNAALLAADSGSASISMAHIIHATARQFRREARVLTPADLGSYGVLLQGAS
jgi:SpoVK/Ycf46/Vps4 family AAA+-type ATPase